jgi:broad specificity phosphatase PhoE
MAEIHIFRHGETEWNLEGRMQGFKDSALTERGKSQAIDARGKIEFVDFDVAYCSTSSRAVDTTKLLLNGHQVPIHKLDNLREINMGKWEGMRYDDVKQQYSLEHYDFWNNPGKFKAVEGESFYELASRSVEVVENIIKKHNGKKVLLVSHAALIKTLLTSLQSRPLDQLWQGPFAENLSHSIVIGSNNTGIQVKQFCDEIWGNSLTGQ